MATYLVTGGTGFIGSYVVDRLLRDGHEVLALSRSRHIPKQNRPKLRHFLGDIRDETAVFEAMAHVDGFIHLAGVLGTQETIQNPRPAFDTNVGGVVNVLEAAARYKVPGVNIAVGNHWENNPYSISKSTAERLVGMYNSYRGTAVRIVRALNAYGPRQSVAAPYGTSKVRKIMPSFIHKTLNGEKIEVYGDGRQVMDMVYVTDVADILVDTLYHTIKMKELAGGDFSNLHSSKLTVIEAGTGVHTSVLDVAMAVASEVHGVNFHSFDGPYTRPQEYIDFLPMRAGESASLPVVADTSTLKDIYGDYGKGFVSLKEGVKRTVEFYRG